VLHQDNKRLENLEQDCCGRSIGEHSKRARRKKSWPPRLTWGLQQQSFAFLASSSSAVYPDGCGALNVTDAMAGGGVSVTLELLN
jgi:hypothetical protein